VEYLRVSVSCPVLTFCRNWVERRSTTSTRAGTPFHHLIQKARRNARSGEFHHLESFTKIENKVKLTEKNGNKKKKKSPHFYFEVKLTGKKMEISKKKKVLTFILAMTKFHHLHR